MLSGLMEAFFEEMGDRDNLAEAVTTADLAIHPSTRIVKHPFQENFTVGEMTVERAEIYLCEPIPWPAGTPVPKPGDYGIYWGALFKFKLEGGGVFWDCSGGRWMVAGASSPTKLSNGNEKSPALGSRRDVKPICNRERPRLLGLRKSF